MVFIGSEHLLGSPGYILCVSMGTAGLPTLAMLSGTFVMCKSSN